MSVCVLWGSSRSPRQARGPPRPRVEDCAGAFQSPHGSAALVETSAASLLQQFVVVISWVWRHRLCRLGAPASSRLAWRFSPRCCGLLVALLPARSCSLRLPVLGPSARIWPTHFPRPPLAAPRSGLFLPRLLVPLFPPPLVKSRLESSAGGGMWPRSWYSPPPFAQLAWQSLLGQVRLLLLSRWLRLCCGLEGFPGRAAWGCVLRRLGLVWGLARVPRWHVVRWYLPRRRRLVVTVRAWLGWVRVLSRVLAAVRWWDSLQ